MSAPITAADVKRHKWWGWGMDDVTFNWRNKPGFNPLAKEKIGIDLTQKPEPVEPQLADHEVPASILGSELQAALEGIVGAENLRVDDDTRVTMSFGRSLPDLFRVRTGRFGRVVDAVVYPGNEDEVAGVLRLAAERNLVVIPYGGGSCISGSVTPDEEEQRPVLSLNMGRMKQLLEIDDTAALARIQAGAYGPELEEQLNEPVSYTHLTLPTTPYV